MSYNSFFISEMKIKNSSLTIISNIFYRDDRLFEIMKFFSTNNEKDDVELASIFANFDNVTLFLCYFGLYIEFDINKFKNSVNLNDYASFIYVLINKIGSKINNQGGVLALLKILQNWIQFLRYLFFMKNITK